jgi:type I restriction enzyme S subunit
MSEKKFIPELRFSEYNNEGEFDVNKLGQIGEPLMCKRILKEQTTSNSKNGVPFYKIGTFGRDADAYIPIDIYSEFKSKYSFPKVGDILISASGTIGRLVVYDGRPAYFQDSNIVWLENDETIVLNTYLFHCYSIVKWQTSDGGVISRLYNSDLKNIKIAYPKSKTEQQKIASCLSSIDEVIAAHSQKLELLKEHKKGMMQNLFPQEGEKVPKYRFKEFENDGEWEEIDILEISTMKARIGWQNLRKEEHLNEGVYYLVTGTDFKNNKIDWGKTKYVDYDRYIQDEHIILKEGDILITKDGSIGKVAYVDELGLKKSTLNNGIFRIRVDSSYCSEFVFHSFLSQRFTIFLDKLSGGSSIVHLYQKDFEKYKIIIPKSIQEQQKIASCLSSLDALITAQAEKIEQLKLHKKGLMQGLFPKIMG